MSITVQQSRLVDEKKKQKYIEETGYDYSKQVQSEIQSFVEANIEFSQSPSILPRAGITNGISISQEDIDAYSAAHPQNEASSEERGRISDILAAGNSTLDKPEEVGEDELQNEQEQQPEIPQPDIHKRFPPIAEISHHITVGFPMTYLKPEENDDFFHRALGSNENLVVIDDFVGQDGKFAFAKSLDRPEAKTFYILRKDFAFRENAPFPTAYDLEAQGAIPTGGETPPWTSLAKDKPKQFSQSAEVHVLVHLDRTTLMKAERPAALEEAFYKGVEKILEFKGKKRTKEYIQEKFVDTETWDKPAQAYELFLDPRGVARKVMAAVKIPVRNIAVLDDQEPEFEFFDEFRTEDFEDMLEKLEDKISSVGDEVEDFDGQVLQFDADKEKQKIEDIPKEIESLAKKTKGFDKDIFDEKGLLKLYWNKNLKPVMVKFKPDVGEEVWFRESLEQFLEKECIQSKRTQFLLSWLKTVVKDTGDDYPWKSFLKDWITNDEVKIIPKPEPPVPVEEAEGPKVKTKEELEKENNFYQNTERKIEVQESREQQSEYVDAPLLSPQNATKTEQIVSKDMEELYDYFLNKVDIQKMALNSTKCLLPDIPIQSFELIKRDFDILEKEYNKIKKQHKEGKLLDFLQPDDLPTDDISEAFFKSLTRSIEGMLSSLISSVVGNLLGAFFSSCGNREKSLDSGLPASDLPELGDLLGDLQNKMQDLFDAGFVDPTTFRDLMNDLTNLLSLRELCDLLRGQPDRETLDVVKGLLESSYCELGLDTDEQIINFFLAVSGSMDLSICDELGTIIDRLPEDFLCPPDSLARENILLGKGMTKEEIKEQIERERDRNRKLAEQLLGDALADGKGPNLFCRKDEQGNTVPGNVPFMDSQFEYTLETTLGSLFRSTYDSFSEEGLRFSQNLFMEVEEQEDQDYDMLGRLPDSPEEPRPLGLRYTKKVTVTKRKPVPHLVEFYNNPTFSESTETELEIQIPSILESSTDGVESLFNNSDFSSNQTLLRMREEMEAAAEEREAETTKVKFSELDYCEILNRQQEPEPTPEPTPEPQSQIEYKTDGLEGNECGDAEPDAKIVAVEKPEITIQEPVPTPGITTNLGIDFGAVGCESQNIIGSSVLVKGKEYISQREIPENVVLFMEDNIGTDTKKNSKTCMEAIFNKSLELENNISSIEKERRIEGFSQVSGKISEEVRNNIFKILMKSLKNSNYLNYQSIGESEGPTYDRYVLEFINLGPTQTPQCDPHLLRLSQLVEEVKNTMKDQFCLDLNPPESEDKPRLSPLEAAMMKACVKATFRHYIIEVLSTSILTTTSFEGRAAELSDLKCSYIIDKMYESMNRYSKPSEGGSCTSSDTFSGDMPSYFEDFVEQVEDVYGGKNGEGNSLLRKAIKEEYKIISDGFLDALLMSDTRESGILYTFLTENVPTLEPEFGTLLTYTDGRRDVSQFMYPFIYLRENRKDYFSLVTETISDDLTSSFQRYVFPDGTAKYIVPIVERTDLNLLTVQQALFGTFFSVEEYAASLSVHEMETVSTMGTTFASFGETKDNLFSLFYAITPEKDDWGKENKALSSVGGTSGLTKLFDFNNNVFDTPCTEFSYNLGSAEVCWGNPFMGLGGFFSTALRMARDAALLEFKRYVERVDPAVKLAKRLSFLSKLACVNIPTSAIAGGLNVSLAFIFPLTPLASIYHALGLGVFLPSSLLNSDSAEGQDARNQIEEAGLRLPPYCGQVFDTTYAQLGLQPEQQTRIEEIDSRIPQAENEIREAEERIEEIEEAIRQNQAELARALMNDNSALELRIRSERQELDSENERKQGEIENLRREIQNLLVEKDSILNPETEEERVERERREQELTEINGQILEKSLRVSELTEEITILSAQIVRANLQGRNTRLKSSQKDDLEEERDSLLEEIEALREQL